MLVLADRLTADNSNSQLEPCPLNWRGAISCIMKRTGASKTRRFAQIVIITLIAGLSALSLSRYVEPRFEGKTLGEWVSSFPLMVDGAGNEFFDDENLLKEVTHAGRAIRELGPDALSRLERELRATDSRLGLARYNVELQWANTLRRDPTYVPAAYRRARAMSALSELGSVGSRYVGELKIAATNKTEEPVVRGHALGTRETCASRTSVRRAPVVHGELRVVRIGFWCANRRAGQE
jgi:hypothetical protein